MADAAFMLELLNTPDYLHFIGDKNVRTIKGAEANIQSRLDSYITNGLGLWLVELKEKNISVGTCGLIKRDSYDDIDIGFAFHPAYFHKGYAFEAASATLKYGFKKLLLEKIVAYTNKDNIASITLLEKLGLQYEKEIQFSENYGSFLYSIKKPN